MEAVRGRVKNNKVAIEEAKEFIVEEKERLELYKKKLVKCRRFIDGLLLGSKKNDEESEYLLRLSNYNRDMEKLEEKIADTKNKKKKFDKENFNFSIDSSIINVAK